MRLSASRCARAATSFGLLLAIASGSARAQPGETGGAAAPPPPALTLGVNSSSSLAQAWTGFWGGTACTRVLDGHFVTLPGCRGVARLAELAAAGTPTSPFELVYHGIGAPGNAVIVTFQDDYDPRVDGCIFSPRMRVTSRDPNGEFFEIRGRHVDGSAVDLAHCERSLADPGLRDPVGDTNPGMWTPFHPLTGCWSDPTKLAVVEGSAVYRGNDGLPCPAVRSIGLDPNGADAISNFRIQVDHDDDPNTPLVAVFVDLDRNGIEGQTIDKRNFQNEFFNGLLPEGQRDPNARTPTVFQSEAAAVSWNILMLLVASSCNQELDDRDQDLDCFDYRVVDGVDRAYLSTRCSFAAPQYCRNLRALTLPEATAEAQAIRAAAGQCLKRVDFSRRLRLLGVRMASLRHAGR